MSFKLHGLKEMMDALDEIGLSKANERNALQRALMDGAEPILQRAKELAPVARGDLQRGIRKDTRKPTGHQSKAAFGFAKSQGADTDEAVGFQKAFNRQNAATFAEAFVGVEKRVPHAWAHEVGTVRHGPTPYIRPAFEEKGEEAMRIVSDRVADELKAAGARAMRKALKKAGRG